MLIVLIAAFLGIWRFRSAEYFKWVAILFVWMLAAALLFSGGGTLDNTAGDGLITREIRRASGDGPAMGIFAIVFVVVYWGGAIFFITRMVREARAIRAAQEASYDDPDYVEDDRSDTSRKVLETIGLLAAATIWIWFAFIRPNQPSATPTTSTPIEPPNVEPLTVEQQVLGAAAEINANVPQRIDAQTVLERASASGRTLTYHYRIDARGADEDDFPSFARQNVVPRVCTGPLRSSMKDPGVTYVFSYQSDTWRNPVSIAINERMCAELET